MIVEEEKVEKKHKNKKNSTNSEQVNTNGSKQVKDSNSKKVNTNNSKQVKDNENIKSSHFWKILFIFIVLFICLIFAIFGIFTVYTYAHSSKIASGVYISGIDVSNLTKDEAQAKLNSYYSEKLSNDITLVHNDYSTYIKTDEIELNFDINSAVNYAFSVGKGQNIFSNNFQTFDALLNGVNITPVFTLNQEKLESILDRISAELPDTVIESGNYIEDNKLIITKGSKGNVVDIQKTANAIKENISNLSYIKNNIDISTIEKDPEPVDLDKIYSEVHKDAKDAYYTSNPRTIYPSETGIDFSISLEEAKANLEASESECVIPLKVLYPRVTTKMLSGDAFPDLLGSFSTKYAASNTNRTTNLRLAANKINGYVLLPGETFSYNKVVGERTIAAGYKEAAIYQNGQVVDGLGGGICQISTTLYNAVLFANLGIVELHTHQFVPSYVKAGRDATVVYGSKDFQFKNTRDYAIKINCSVSNGVASFEIKGLKQNPEYEVNVYANVTSRTSTAIKSSTYRTIKLNGQTIKTENLINSTYKVH